MKNPEKYFLLVCCSLFSLSILAQEVSEDKQLTIHFLHEANGEKIIQSDSSYLNAFNEPYRINKLRYYISNITFNKILDPAVFLIDAFGEDSLNLAVEKGFYKSLEFMLGVDSALQTSGAQSGALDPLNGMYWTWNSGYVNFKLEGNSDSSSADLQRIEHHIGGYRAPYATMRKIKIELPKPIRIQENTPVHIYIRLNLDNYWNSVQALHIQEHPLIMSSGKLPHSIADNFTSLFTIHSIEYKNP